MRPTFTHAKSMEKQCHCPMQRRTSRFIFLCLCHASNDTRSIVHGTLHVEQEPKLMPNSLKGPRTLGKRCILPKLGDVMVSQKSCHQPGSGVFVGGGRLMPAGILAGARRIYHAPNTAGCWFRKGLRQEFIGHVTRSHSLTIAQQRIIGFQRKSMLRFYGGRGCFCERCPLSYH